ncbi:MAG: D-alanyl-D-alanine carboxypeptidase [Firmicutes bacterium]|nr:D-alanyl-D-alanine carboxypeptidase [Bacillota bacterium]
MFVRTRLVIWFLIMILLATMVSQAGAEMLSQAAEVPKAEVPKKINPGTDQTPPPGVNIQSPSAVLIDFGTGTILYEKDAKVQRPPASITKVMVILLAMEAIRDGKIFWQDKVKGTQESSRMGGSQIWLEVGEEFTLEQMMMALSIVSANDAAVAVGEHIAGTHEAFVMMMNERARQLGMKDTVFKNATGLPEEGHITTAYDIALMSRELLKYPKIHDWLTVWLTYMERPDGTSVELKNTNRLIRTYPGADGLKTGWTNEANYGMSATAKRGDFRLISVVLGAPSSEIRNTDASRLMDWGFANWASRKVSDKGQVWGEIKVQKGNPEKIGMAASEELFLLARKGKLGEPKIELKVPRTVTAPLRKGQEIGYLAAVQDGKVMAQVPLVAQEEVFRAGSGSLIWRLIKWWLRAGRVPAAPDEKAPPAPDTPGKPGLVPGSPAPKEPAKAPAPAPSTR